MFEVVRTHTVRPVRLPNVQNTFVLIACCRSVTCSTRIKAILRLRDILQDHPELYVWLYCSSATAATEMYTHVSSLRRTIEGIRASIRSSSTFTADITILDNITNILNCHWSGFQVLTLSRGRIDIVGQSVEVNWDNVSEFTNKEEKQKWGVLFQYLLNTLLYVAYFRPCA